MLVVGQSAQSPVSKMYAPLSAIDDRPSYQSRSGQQRNFWTCHVTSLQSMMNAKQKQTKNQALGPATRTQAGED